MSGPNSSSHSERLKGTIENSLYYYSQKMSQLIETDLASKLEDLDFDKDPY